VTSTAPFPEESDQGGRFVRQQSRFRGWVSADGSTPFAPAAGRYHLYVSYACPWAHRAIIVRALKGLQGAIGMTAVDPIRDGRGWRFNPEVDRCEPDPINRFDYLAEAYEASAPGFKGRVTVPVLWDTESGRIVNNESADIIRMLTGAFDEWAGEPGLDLYPEALREEIDIVNARVYQDVNDGVYRSGFAASQAAYEEAVYPLFETLDWLEERLTERRYLVGGRITEADWRLFTTLLRFDPVYVGHFKCNIRRIVDYPALSGYLRELYQWPKVRETVDFDHIKRHYYVTHRTINPTGIVPVGPVLDLEAPHGRERLSDSAARV
jgi:glutathionyl-hydroquinone reductase